MFLRISLFQKVLNLIFPIFCLGCSRYEGNWACPRCRDAIVLRSSKTLEIDLPSLEGVWAATNYKQPVLETLLHAFKYRYVKEIGVIFGDILAKYYSINICDLRNVLVVPMPLSRKRRYWRGFNQAELIAKQFVQNLGLTIIDDRIITRCFRRPQVGLTAKQRKMNVSAVFSVVDAQVIAGHDILIIDDVVTTGATLAECALALKKAGARRVYGLCVAAD